MTNDAPHKSQPDAAAILQQTCSEDAPGKARARQAAEAFFLLWHDTLRAAASMEAAAPMDNAAKVDGDH